MKNPLICFLGCWLVATGLALGQGGAEGDLQLRGVSLISQKSLNLEAANYAGEGTLLMLRTEGEEPTILTLHAGTVLEDARLVAGSRSQMVIQGAVLRRCQLFGEAKSRIILQDCLLDGCEINGSGDPEVGFPSIELIGSVLHQCSWLKPVNWMGLKMQRCTVWNMMDSAALLRTVSGFGSLPRDLAQAPAIVQCRFNKCQVSPTLLLAVSETVFEACEIFPLPDKPLAAGPASEEDVPIRLSWRQSVPDWPSLPPYSGVRLEPMDADGGAGSGLRMEVEGNRATSLDLVASQTSRSLKDALMQIHALSESGAGGLKPKLRQTQVKGLLIQQLASGQEAGTANLLTLTVVPGVGRMKFSQGVGASMTTALQAVERFIQARHGSLSGSDDFVISFEDKYSGKDGPSAAVACALLVEAVVTGKTWDPAFAVTGDMNEDGSVQPIGGVAAKVRGAANGGAQIVAIPAKNEGALLDTLLLDGPNALCRAAVFRIATFEEAAALATPERQPVLQQALEEWKVVREVLVRDPRAQTAILRTPQAVARLSAILEKAPNCLSARHLLAYAQGRLPAALSLSGSIEQTDASGMAILQAIQKDLNASSSLKPDDVGGAINRLRNLRPRTDRRVWSYLDSLVSYGEILRGAIVNPIRSGARAQEVSQRIDGAVDRINSTKQALFADPQVIEELGL